jgi:hypothetical protein
MDPLKDEPGLPAMPLYQSGYHYLVRKFSADTIPGTNLALSRMEVTA